MDDPHLNQNAPQDPTATDTATFETALAELERVVRRMQDPSCSLDEALKLFARGSELTQHCHQKLAEVEAKVTMLTEDAEGQLVETPMPD